VILLILMRPRCFFKRQRPKAARRRKRDEVFVRVIRAGCILSDVLKLKTRNTQDEKNRGMLAGVYRSIKSVIGAGP
jgi:GH25 family lysozyme M1 (1,4-beta-N-acetylmuramidase)